MTGLCSGIAFALCPLPAKPFIRSDGGIVCDNPKLVGRRGNLRDSYVVRSQLNNVRMDANGGQLSRNFVERRVLFRFAMLSVASFTWIVDPKKESFAEETEKRGSQRGVYIDLQDFPYLTGRYSLLTVPITQAYLL